MPSQLVHPGRIEWTGENPVIQLKTHPDGPYSCSASFFRVPISPFGYGHAAFVFPSPNEEGAPNACCTDNRPMAEWLLSEFLSCFGPYKALPALHGLRMLEDARFSFSTTPPGAWVENIEAEGMTVVLRWLGLQEPFLAQVPADQSATGRHEMISVIVPAMRGEIIVNGDLLPGTLVPRQMDDRPFYSAFLAFETWIRQHG